MCFYVFMCINPYLLKTINLQVSFFRFSQFHLISNCRSITGELRTTGCMHSVKVPDEESWRHDSTVTDTCKREHFTRENSLNRCHWLICTAYHEDHIVLLVLFCNAVYPSVHGNMSGVWPEIALYWELSPPITCPGSRHTSCHSWILYKMMIMCISCVHVGLCVHSFSNDHYKL